MTILDPQRSAEEERAQRRATRMLMLLAVIVSVACVFFAYVIFVPDTRRLAVGSTAEFPRNQPVERPVPQLSMTSFIRSRPRVSQDLVYITHRSNGSWQALLGIDVRSGCFLTWDERRQVFADGCSGRSYDQQGRNTASSVQGPDMARLPVEVHDGQVYVVDRLCREGRPCP